MLYKSLILTSTTDLVYLLKFLGGKKVRDRSNTKQSSSSSLNEKLPSASRSNILTAYYSNILLPKFRMLTALPSSVHQSSLMKKWTENNKEDLHFDQIELIPDIDYTISITFNNNVVAIGVKLAYSYGCVVLRT